MDYFSAIRAFLFAAELGSFSKAANRIDVKTSTVSRYVSELERERRRWENVCKTQDPKAAESGIAGKNLAIIMKRFEKMKEIRQYLMLARGQLDLIENSFQLIADQIVTMQSPQELTGQLDELLDGVESIKQTAADTERLLNPMGLKDLNV